MKTAPASRGEPLRVLHLRDTHRLCGPGKTIRETVRLNTDPGVQYEVASFGDGISNPFLEEFRGLCPAFPLPESRLLLPLTAVRTARSVRQKGIRLLHAHDFKTDALAIAVGRISGVPVVTTVHGYIAITGKSKLYKAADLQLLRRMRGVIAVSRAMVSDLQDRGLPGDRICLVPNCISTDAYPFGYRSSTVRSFLGLSANHLVVGHIGRLSPEKGQARLLEAFPEVLRAVPEARLVFAGDGPDAKRLAERTADLALEGFVHLLGYRADIREVFGGLDVLVLNSETEGLPNVILEAMALGVPVVATAVGGTPELVEDGVTGVLVPTAAASALSEAIVRVLRTGEDAARRARAAREFVEREHAMEVLIRRTHELYRQIERDTA